MMVKSDMLYLWLKCKLSIRKYAIFVISSDPEDIFKAKPSSNSIYLEPIRFDERGKLCVKKSHDAKKEIVYLLPNHRTTGEYSSVTHWWRLDAWLEEKKKRGFKKKERAPKLRYLTRCNKKKAQTLRVVEDL